MPETKGRVFPDARASAGKAVMLWDESALRVSVDGPSKPLAIRARGDRCGAAAPHLRVRIDGRVVADTSVGSARWTTISTRAIPSGKAHGLELAFTNAFQSRRCNRNLRLDVVRGVEARAPALSDAGADVEGDAAAEEDATPATADPGTPPATAAAPDQPDPQPAAADPDSSPTPAPTPVPTPTTPRPATPRPTTPVTMPTPATTPPVPPATTPATEPTQSTPEPQPTTPEPTTPDATTPEPTTPEPTAPDQTTTPEPTTPEPSTPEPSTPEPTTPAAPAPPLYVAPNGSAAQQAEAWRTTRPDDAALMDRIAEQPMALWLGDWTTDPEAVAQSRTLAAEAAGAMPSFVVAAIPGRGCGVDSGGGLPGATEYAAWIGQFAAGIGDRAAIVVLEPDALTGTGCLTPEALEARYAMLSDAVRQLGALPATRVYLDAGRSGMRPPTEMAARLTMAGISGADGFAVNVSGVSPTDTELAYGRSIAPYVGDRPFVIDTSRSGPGPAQPEPCNPADRALGPRPTLDTGQADVAGYLWLRPVGESDGTCNGGPAPGTWWAEYALGLAQRTAW